MRRLLFVVALAACPGTPEPASPLCGDGAVDEGEACDDGNGWGGDGCTHLCTAEDGPGESEDNDSPEDAEPLDGGLVHGSLVPGDRDCFAVAVDEAGSVRAELSGPVGCPEDALLELHDPEGVRITAALPGACAIDPDLDTWARYLSAGTHAVCVQGAFDAVVPSYELTLTTADSCTELPALTPDPAQDFEADGLADVCDPDDDDDGVDDAEDNCPFAPNGPDQPFPWSTADRGFVNLWAILGPFTGNAAQEACAPTDFDPIGVATAEPAFGATVDDRAWFAHFHRPERSPNINFNAWFADEAPREAYAATWVFSPDARDAQLTVGADDGHVAWLSGVEVGRDTGCHGVGADAFRYDVSLEAGWTPLILKVYDGGGGWGLVARFYEPDGETPMTDLELSIGGPEPWLDVQGDADGDGLGDLCDPAPFEAR